MNDQERAFFNALTEHRSKIADAMSDPCVEGFKSSVTGKYTDQTHFVYELLQNADDAHATSARFALESSHLIFAHNGKRLFSVSDPKTEADDKKAGRLGDINSICSVGNSNKTAQDNKIGKFGVGFKAVFDYTETPHIYDPNFCFRIERFIVPVLLDEDFSDRRTGETLFVFPFNEPNMEAEKAYADISEKLRDLSFPLLFLSELKDIEFSFDGVIGLYEKSIEKSYTFGDISAELVCLTQNRGDELYEEKLWLFSCLDENQCRYSVGFFVDENGCLRPVDEPAFCFFPTREETGLRFIIHAPFLLTDSREGIRAGIDHNDHMIKLLAELAARSIVLLKEIGEREGLRLIDDDILNIIPYDPRKFSDPSSKRKISFRPFYDSIKAVFETEEIIPTIGGYISKENAYWAANPRLPQLFSNEQLALICDNPAACWAYPSIGRDETLRNNETLLAFLDSLLRTNLGEDAIIEGRSREYFFNRYRGERQSIEPIKGITASFIEAQSISWLLSFYKWISETKHRRDLIRNKPVFLDQDGIAVSAYDKNNHLGLFLPVADVDGYSVVHPALLEDADTRSLIEEIGIKTPQLRDQIYTKILPLYKDDKKISGDTSDTHFKLFFDYYCQSCMNGEDEEFIDLIKDYKFLKCSDETKQKLISLLMENGRHTREEAEQTLNDIPELLRKAASSLYLPTTLLVKFFETKPDLCPVAIDFYKQLVGPSKQKQLISFLTELGIKKEIEIETIQVEESVRKDLPHPYHYTKYRYWEEDILVGCKEIVEYIVANNDREKSIVLWNCLLSVIKEKCSDCSLSDILQGRCVYFYYEEKELPFPSSDQLHLKNEPWLMTRNGEFVDARNVTKANLAEEYNTSSIEAQKLLEFLGISDVEDDSEETWEAHIPDDEREMLKMLKDHNITAVELKNLIQSKSHTNKQQPVGPRSGSDQSDDARDEKIDDNNNHTAKVMQEISRRFKTAPPKVATNEPEPEVEIDQDDYSLPEVDYSKKIELAKEKSARDIAKIARLEELQERLKAMDQYTFGWFTTLLEMESLNSGEANSRSKEVSIRFEKVEQVKGSARHLVLKQPNRYIPQFMEELFDVPLVLHFGDERKKIAIEVISKKSYTLEVKLKSGAEIEGIDLDAVDYATIDAQSPAFLVESLKNAFTALNYADDFNMKDHLCENIEFIFGPPGTGKTTHLAKNVLLPLMQGLSNYKVLVLTPTNKAADVLVRKIMELSPDSSYEDWLLRFGSTNDDVIEGSPVFRDKTFDIRSLPKSVTVTTIARFPYDYFMPPGARISLQGINWDYIVIDEASMISIANIVYPLYKKSPQKFIIAGDPFQIEPIASMPQWKNENIYTMVHLKSFAVPKTEPHPYKVELLTTQYRSIPAIGEVFSGFAYNGILRHYRAAESRKPLNIDDSICSLNIIKYPVKKYESIYRPKRLQHSSSYQIYSALFTFEYIRCLAQKIADANPQSSFNIGVIAPYKAQADMIDKLVASEKWPNEVGVQVGTIHSFQGDECDIVFAVFNTPPTISDSTEMFLNKINIINVAISRARDYLFIVMPDDETENIEKLDLVKKVEQLVKKTDYWQEISTAELETLLFGEESYLEEKSFSTSHQSVNVYGPPEKCYEIRTEDNAVDIQIHREVAGNEEQQMN